LPVDYTVTNTSGAFQFCTAGFYASTDDVGADVLVIYDPAVGYTTSGSDNPRTELRQTTTSGANAGWFLNQTTLTTLTVTQRIMHLPSVYQSLTVVQIFDTTNGHFVEVQTRICRGKSYERSAAGATNGCAAGGLYMVIYWVDSVTQANNYIFLDRYTVGTKYTLTAAAGNSAIVFTYNLQNGGSVTYTLPCPAASCGAYSSSKGLYFKAGAYMQYAYLEANTDYALLYMYSAVVA